PSRGPVATGGLSPQSGKRGAPTPGNARIHAQTRPDSFGQSPPIGRLAAAADQRARRKAASAMMSYVYRLRWQVELIFRQAKSVLRLDKTESQNPCRVQSEIWARLICAILLFSWHAHASAECWRRHQCEASFEKLIRMMQHWGHTIARAFLDGPARLLQELRALWKNLLVNARKGR